MGHVKVEEIQRLRHNLIGACRILTDQTGFSCSPELIFRGARVKSSITDATFGFTMTIHGGNGSTLMVVPVYFDGKHLSKGRFELINDEHLRHILAEWYNHHVIKYVAHFFGITHHGSYVVLELPEFPDILAKKAEKLKKILDHQHKKWTLLLEEVALEDYKKDVSANQLYTLKRPLHSEVHFNADKSHGHKNMKLSLSIFEKEGPSFVNLTFQYSSLKATWILQAQETHSAYEHSFDKFLRGKIVSDLKSFLDNYKFEVHEQTVHQKEKFSFSA